MVIKTLPVPSTKEPLVPKFDSGKRLLHSQSVSFPLNQRSAHSEERHLPNAADLRRMCVITKTDLNRIYENLDRRQRDKDAVRQEIERKKEMAERSAEITKLWPNTILGARERKLQMKQVREQEEEERRKVIDIEEEKIAAERRREQIEKAKQQQYYQTDRVRTFHSALLLSEVLKERDLQIEMKKRIEEMRQTDNDEEQKRFEQGQKEFFKSEQEKFEQRLKERAQLTQYHRAQMDQRRSLNLDAKRKDREEGIEYRRLAEQYALEQIEIERFRKENQRDVRNMYDQAVDDKLKVKEIERQLDEEEDEQLRIYADAKKKIARMRRDKELQVHREKQEARDHMTGYLASLQKRAEADYETNIFKAANEQAAKAQREEQEKFEKQKKMNESIRKHRHETMKRHQAEREIAEREEIEMQKKKTEADRLYHLYQEEKERRRQEDAQILSQFHLQQKQERKDRQRVAKQNELEEVQMEKHLNEFERRQYKDYTGQVINYMDENGRNVYPMKRAVVEEMRRFDQISQETKDADGTNSTGEKNPTNYDQQNLDETKKHLGFQWNQTKK